MHLKTISRQLIISILFCCLNSLLLNLKAQTDEFAITSECIIQLSPEGNIDEIIAANKKISIKEVLSKQMKIYLLEKQNDVFLTDEITELARKKSVIAAQHNHKVDRRNFVPNDPYFSQQWNMLNTGQLNGKTGTDIKATEAWEINNSPLTKNGDTLVVAVIDEYFALGHEDLNFFVNRNETPNNGIDDDGNGFIDDYQGWNAYNNNGDVLGGSGTNHSTGISGIIGAYTNNSTGVAGIVSGVKILPIGASSTQESVVIKGYDYAIEMRKLWNQTNGAKGAFIVAGNSSFGVDKGNPANYPIWCALYDTMGKLGILNAAATTNQNLDVDTQGDIPTTCPSKWLISVTGHSASDNRYGGYGLNNIDIAAPASSVISTYVGNNYGSQSGTSFACPHIAGAIAAMFAEACPQFINDYFAAPDSLSLIIKDWLLNAVTKTSALNNKTTSDGRLNLYQAILNTHNYDCSNCGSKILINAKDVRCKGENNGSAKVELNNNSNFSLLWSDGDTSRLRTNLKPGCYQLTLTDNTNCTNSAVLIIREPDTLFISNITIVPPTQTSGNIIVSAYGGGDSLWYSLDETNWQLNNIFSINTLDTYNVWVKNESGCVVSQSVLVNNIETPGTVKLLSIAPNPASENFNLHLYSATPNFDEIKLFDITGKLVLSKAVKLEQGANNFSIPLFETKSGTYFVKSNLSNKAIKLSVIR